MNKTFSLCYETRGNSNHPCIMLVMGIGGQLIDWPEMFVQGLVNKGYYVVMFDNRDSGLSHYYDELGVPNLDEMVVQVQQGKAFYPPYTLEDMAADVVHLMDELHIDKAHIMGMSMGGIIAQYVAINHAHRVLSLTCIATSSGDPQLPPPEQEVSDYFAQSMKRKNVSMEQYIENKLRLLKIYNPQDFDEEKSRIQIQKSFERANHPAGFKRLITALICAKPRTEQLKQIQLPCFIIHGDRDPVFPIEHAEQLAACIPHSRLVIIEKMGHGLPDSVCEKIISLL